MVANSLVKSHSIQFLLDPNDGQLLSSSSPSLPCCPIPLPLKYVTQIAIYFLLGETMGTTDPT